MCGPPLIIEAGDNIGNISTLSTLITEGAQHHPTPNRRYKRNQIPLDEFSLTFAELWPTSTGFRLAPGLTPGITRSNFAKPLQE